MKKALPTEYWLVCLRARSRESHRRMERHPRMRLLLSPQLTLQDYGALLQDLFSYHHALDNRIAGLQETLFSPGERYCWQSRSAWLEQDLNDLRFYRTEANARSKPELPPVRSSDELIGVMYVIEGSSQGGRVIAPLLERRIALSSDFGARYFNAHRHGSWLAFLDWADALSEHIDVNKAAKAANRVFDTLGRHLDRTARSTARDKTSA